MSPRSKFVISLTRSFLMITSVFSLFDYLENPNLIDIEDSYSNYKFLLFTKISLFLTIISSVSAIVYRLTGSYYFIANLLLPISFTFEFIVTAVYWILFMIDKRLIITTNLPESDSPILSRLASHVFPFFLTCFEKMEFKIEPSEYHLIFFMCFGVLYYILITVYALYFGRYIYPFLDKLNVIQRLIFFVGISCLGIVVYTISFAWSVFRKQTVNFKSSRLQDG